MFKTICILLVSSFLSIGFAKSINENFKLIYPENIPVNSTFDVSIITPKLYSKAETFELYILQDGKIPILKIELRNLKGNINLSFVPVS